MPIASVTKFFGRSLMFGIVEKVAKRYINFIVQDILSDNNCIVFYLLAFNFIWFICLIKNFHSSILIYTNGSFFNYRTYAVKI